MINYDELPAFDPITENPIILDFTKNKTLWDIHMMLKKKFGFPDFYGKNWSALWDMMRDVFSDDEKYVVELHGFYSLPKDMIDECQTMLTIFDRVVEEATDFSYKIIS